MSDSVVAVVTFRPLPGRGPEVVELLAPIVAGVHEEPGCLLYALNEASDGSFWFVEKWATAADAERHASSSPALPALAERLSPLLEGVPVIVQGVAHPLGDPAKGAL